MSSDGLRRRNVSPQGERKSNDSEEEVGMRTIMQLSTIYLVLFRQHF